MRVKNINIINFRGFQNKTVVFNGNLTVVIGNNTAGKTTLLKALQVGLGAYLQSLKNFLEELCIVAILVLLTVF